MRIQFDQHSTFLAVYTDLEGRELSYVVPVIGFEVETAKPMVPSPSTGALVSAAGIEGFLCLAPVVVLAAGIDSALEYIEKLTGRRLAREEPSIVLARPLPN